MVIIENNNLGIKIKKIRKNRGYSLTQLSELTGLSVGYLSNVERNKNSPTVSSLRKIVDALGITVPDLFDNNCSKRKHVKKSERKELIRTNKEGIKYELLTTDICKKMEPLLLTVEPGSSSGKEQHQHEGEEFGFIIQGELTYYIGQDKYHLQTGDSIYHLASELHSYKNEGNITSISLWIVTPPSF
ncbi:MAG: cupin domain-containing protein [Bacillota bacterium]